MADCLSYTSDNEVRPLGTTLPVWLPGGQQSCYRLPFLSVGSWKDFMQGLGVQMRIMDKILGLNLWGAPLG